MVPRVAAAVILLLAASQPLLGQEDQRARTLELDREASDRLDALQRESAALGARADSLLGRLQRLEGEREERTRELAQLDQQIARTAQVLEETGRQIGELHARVEAQRPRVLARLVETYKLGQARYARLLLSVNDLRGLGRSYRMVNELARLDRRRIQEYRTTIAALGSTAAALGEQQAEDRRLRGRAQAARRELDASIAEQSELLARIAEQREVNEQFTAELERSRKVLQATLSAMATNAPATSASASTPTAPTLPLGPFQGVIEWPVAGAASRASNEPGPQAGTVIVRDGIEIAARQGLAVKAVHPGRVAFADRFTGFGNLVIVDHGGESYSVYGYLSVIAVRQGAPVVKGQILGSVGRSPVGVPSLYFELRIDGAVVDPLQWLGESRPQD